MLTCERVTNGVWRMMCHVWHGIENLRGIKSIASDNCGLGSGCRSGGAEGCHGDVGFGGETATPAAHALTARDIRVSTACWRRGRRGVICEEGGRFLGERVLGDVIFCKKNAV